MVDSKSDFWRICSDGAPISSVVLASRPKTPNPDLPAKEFRLPYLLQLLSQFVLVNHYGLQVWVAASASEVAKIAGDNEQCKSCGRCPQLGKVLSRHQQ